METTVATEKVISTLRTVDELAIADLLTMYDLKISTSSNDLKTWSVCLIGAKVMKGDQEMTVCAESETVDRATAKICGQLSGRTIVLNDENQTRILMPRKLILE